MPPKKPTLTPPWTQMASHLSPALQNMVSLLQGKSLMPSVTPDPVARWTPAEPLPSIPYSPTNFTRDTLSRLRDALTLAPADALPGWMDGHRQWWMKTPVDWVAPLMARSDDVGLACLAGLGCIEPLAVRFLVLFKDPWAALEDPQMARALKATLSRLLPHCPGLVMARDLKEPLALWPAYADDWKAKADMVRFLMEAGADFSVRDEDGITAGQGLFLAWAETTAPDKPLIKRDVELFRQLHALFPVAPHVETLDMESGRSDWTHLANEVAGYADDINLPAVLDFAMATFGWSLDDPWSMQIDHEDGAPIENAPPSWQDEWLHGGEETLSSLMTDLVARCIERSLPAAAIPARRKNHL